MLYGDLERQVDRALKRLPGPKAPDTLLPRVLAAVEAWANRPWYSRAWFTWPLGWQAASVVVFALLVYAIWTVPGTVPIPESLVVTTSSAAILWRALVEPFLTYALVIIVLMGLACAVFGTALNYVFLERTADR